jgi:hypothetical protein
MRASARLAFALEPPMMDVVYTALTAGLIALTWGLVRLCDKVA